MLEKLGLLEKLSRNSVSPPDEFCQPGIWRKIEKVERPSSCNEVMHMEVMIILALYHKNMLYMISKQKVYHGTWHFRAYSVGFLPDRHI